MFSPPSRGFHRQKQLAPKLTLLSTSQQDVIKHFDEHRGSKLWNGGYCGSGAVKLAIFMLICGCCLQSVGGSPYSRLLEDTIKERATSPRALFYSSPYTKGSQEVIESQILGSSTGGQVTTPLTTGGSTASSLTSGNLLADELEKSTDVADAADQDLEELVNALKCECSGLVKPSCIAACASRNETTRYPSNNTSTSGCFCDGKWLDSCPQRCIPISATKVDNIGKLVSNTTVYGNGLTNSFLTSSGTDDMFKSNAYSLPNLISNSSISNLGLGNQIIEASDGSIDIATGKFSSERLLQPVGRPCICKGKYHRICTAECLKLGTTKQLPIDELPGFLPAGFTSPLPPSIGKVDHPDHASGDAVIDLEPMPSKTNLSRPSPVSTRIAETVVEENGEIIRHRKVYVTERPRRRSAMRPFKITIPIKLDEPKTTYIEPPQPVFKMRTYTEYETKPETVRMPVVTTIIKPKNIRKEQMVD